MFAPVWHSTSLAKPSALQAQRYHAMLDAIAPAA
jgi:hypothetical protein